MDWKNAALAIMSALTAIGGWFLKRQDDRIADLEKERGQLVTRDHLDEVRSSITASFQNSHARIEDKLDRLIERRLK